MFRFFPLLLILLLFLTMGCNTNPGVEPLDIANQPEWQEQTGPIILGEGDQLSISVFREEELNTTATVDYDGNIFMPLVGTIQARGMTIPKLRQAITQKLALEMVNPQVMIELTQQVSSSIYVLGEVSNPGIVILTKKTTLLEALYKSGGVTSDANDGNVLLVRMGSDATRVASVNANIRKAIAEQNFGWNVNMKKDDIVFVPMKAIANIEDYALRITNIINAIIGVERLIVLYPEVEAALNGTSNVQISVGG